MRLMKSLTRFVIVATTASMLLVPVAQADRGRGKGHDRHHGYDRHYDRGGKYDRGRSDNRGYKHSYSRKHYHYAPPRTVVVRRPPPVYYAPPRTSVTVTYGRSYGPYYTRGYAPRYSVGHYYSYAPHTVYITDYHRHGLYAPPSGYHWVRDRDRGDAILASVATGAIIGLVVGALAY